MEPESGSTYPSSEVVRQAWLTGGFPCLCYDTREGKISLDGGPPLITPNSDALHALEDRLRLYNGVRHRYVYWYLAQDWVWTFDRLVSENHSARVKVRHFFASHKISFLMILRRTEGSFSIWARDATTERYVSINATAIATNLDSFLVTDFPGDTRRVKYHLNTGYVEPMALYNGVELVDESTPEVTWQEPESILLEADNFLAQCAGNTPEEQVCKFLNCVEQQRYRCVTFTVVFSEGTDLCPDDLLLEFTNISYCLRRGALADHWSSIDLLYTDSVLAHMAKIRLTEEALPPLGNWLWTFDDDTLRPLPWTRI